MTEENFFELAHGIIKNHNYITSRSERYNEMARDWEKLLTPLTHQKFIYLLSYLVGANDDKVPHNYQLTAQALGIVTDCSIKMAGIHIEPAISLSEVCRRIAYIQTQ